MKKNLIIVFFFFLTGILLMRCDKDKIYQEVDCSLCFPTPPDSGFLRPEITIDPLNVRVPVDVYEGPVEDHKLVFRDTFSIPTPRIGVPVGKEYSLTATYRKGNDTIIVLDGDKLEVKNAVGQCGGTCYVVTGGFFDLRLK
jgi:hypothetical protein